MQTLVIEEVVAELVRQLMSDYVFEDVVARMIETVTAKVDAQVYSALTSDAALAKMLTDDLRAVSRDKHLQVVVPEPDSNDGSRTSPPMRPQPLNGGVSKVEVFSGNIGYMDIVGVPNIETSRNAIAAAFAFLHDTNALILDNRRNHGGDLRTVAFYMSYLSEGAPYVVNRFHWRGDARIEEFETTDLGPLTYGNKKPVLVLTSAATFSGGEELAYDVQAFGRGLTVGEATAGGAHPTRQRPLVHGFYARIPFGRPVNPVTGKNWEGVGVKPNIEIPAEQALIEARRVALARLRSTTQDRSALLALDAAALELTPCPTDPS